MVMEVKRICQCRVVRAQEGRGRRLQESEVTGVGLKKQGTICGASRASSLLEGSTALRGC